MHLNKILRANASVYTGKSTDGKNQYKDIPVQEALETKIGRLSFVAGTSMATARKAQEKLSKLGAEYTIVKTETKTGDEILSLEPVAVLSGKWNVSLDDEA